MAKWGEGDPRWIVEERPDAVNVNNWHWTEKNCKPWADEYLKKHLVQLSVTSKDGDTVDITEIPYLHGEVSLNNRKGKVYYFFELEMNLKWSGKTKDEATGTGRIELRDIVQDDSPDEYDIRIVSDDDNSAAYTNAFLPLIQNELMPIIKKRFITFQTDLKAENASKVLLPPKEVDANTPPAHKPANGNAAGAASKDNKDAAKTTTTKSSSSSTSGTRVATLTLKVELLASAEDICNTLTDVNRVRIWSQSQAEISNQPGAKFTIYNGNITGENIKCESGKILKQKWRLSHWPSDVVSTVTMEFEQGSSSTQVHLIQTGVPDDELEATRVNWNRFYFDRLKSIFGWGI